MSLQIDLKNKVALITGVTSGIGAGIAKQFARAGARVAGCGRTAPDGEGARNFINDVTAAGGQPLYIGADVTDKQALKELVTATAAYFGGIDILVSNAGMNIFEGAANCSEEKWEENIRLNLTAHWQLATLCRPYLEKSDPGVIIIMTSNHGYASIPGCFPYNIAKTALTGLVRSLAIEWGPKIRTVGIAPGFIDTPGNQQWFDAHTDAEKERQRTIRLHPVKRIGTAEEVGAWCAFLACEYSAFATGVTYLLDGGRSALMQDDQA